MEGPAQEIGSVGAHWPPQPVSHERLKGFYPEVVGGRDSADALEARVQEALQTMRDEQLGRLSVRTVVELGALPRLAKFEGTSVEAVVPIAGENLGIAYLGANALRRCMSDEQLASHDRLLRSVIARDADTSPEALFADESLGLRASVVNPAEAADLAEAFMPLYAPFGYGREETEVLLGDKSSTIAYIAAADGTVLSTAMAERASVPVVGYGDLHLAEITEASTRPEWRGRGLYAAISGFLARQLVEQRTEGEAPLDVLYGESNLAAPGVLLAAHQNGRRFARGDGQRLGIDNPTFGILPQNVTIEDGRESRPYNDFAVSYVDLDNRR